MGIRVLTMKLQDFRLYPEPLSGDPYFHKAARTLSTLKRERIEALKCQQSSIGPTVEIIAKGIYYGWHGLFVAVGFVAGLADYWLHKWAFDK